MVVVSHQMVVELQNGNTSGTPDEILESFFKELRFEMKTENSFYFPMHSQDSPNIIVLVMTSKRGFDKDTFNFIAKRRDFKKRILSVEILYKVKYVENYGPQTSNTS